MKKYYFIVSVLGLFVCVSMFCSVRVSAEEIPQTTDSLYMVENGDILPAFEETSTIDFETSEEVTVTSEAEEEINNDNSTATSAMNSDLGNFSKLPVLKTEQLELSKKIFRIQLISD